MFPKVQALMCFYSDKGKSHLICQNSTNKKSRKFRETARLAQRNHETLHALKRVTLSLIIEFLKKKYLKNLLYGILYLIKKIDSETSTNVWFLFCF